VFDQAAIREMPCCECLDFKGTPQSDRPWLPEVNAAGNARYAPSGQGSNSDPLLLASLEDDLTYQSQRKSLKGLIRISWHSHRLPKATIEIKI